jgi:DNA-binding winged helix-turn-helix (wHTH) protein
MRLLVCLAGHAGQVVSIEQLLDEVWSDVVVNLDSVYQAATMLRRVLGALGSQFSEKTYGCP